MNEPDEIDADELRTVGLCVTCGHARRIVSAKGSRFYRCGLAKTDARFRDYPPLPVRACPGHVAAAPAEGA